MKRDRYQENKKDTEDAMDSGYHNQYSSMNTNSSYQVPDVGDLHSSHHYLYPGGGISAPSEKSSASNPSHINKNDFPVSTTPMISAMAAVAASSSSAVDEMSSRSPKFAKIGSNKQKESKGSELSASAYSHKPKLQNNIQQQQQQHQLQQQQSSPNSSRIEERSSSQDDMDETLSGEDDDASSSNQPWTLEEDQLLLLKQEEIGNKWAIISSFLPQRNQNQLKVRFKSILRAAKREWTQKENELLIKLHHETKGDWVLIAPHFPHRTKNAVRKHHRLLMKMKRENSIPQQPPLGAPNQIFFQKPQLHSKIRSVATALLSASAAHGQPAASPLHVTQESSHANTSFSASSSSESSPQNIQISQGAISSLPMNFSIDSTSDNMSSFFPPIHQTKQQTQMYSQQQQQQSHPYQQNFIPQSAQQQQLYQQQSQQQSQQQQGYWQSGHQQNFGFNVNAANWQTSYYPNALSHSNTVIGSGNLDAAFQPSASATHSSISVNTDISGQDLQGLHSPIRTSRTPRQNAAAAAAMQQHMISQPQIPNRNWMTSLTVSPSGSNQQQISFEYASQMGGLQQQPSSQTVSQLQQPYVSSGVHYVGANLQHLQYQQGHESDHDLITQFLDNDQFSPDHILNDDLSNTFDHHE